MTVPPVNLGSVADILSPPKPPVVERKIGWPDVCFWAAGGGLTGPRPYRATSVSQTARLKCLGFRLTRHVIEHGVHELRLFAFGEERARDVDEFGDYDLRRGGTLH